MTQTDLAAKAQVSLTTVRELVHNLNARRRHPRTLSALSEALGWPSDHLNELLKGKTSGPDSDAPDPVADELQTIRQQLEEVHERLASIERTETAVASLHELLGRISARLDQLERDEPHADA
jgi:DNA-binding FadR family transcriptional regulator